MAVSALADLLAVRPPREELDAIAARFHDAIAGEASEIDLRVNRLGRTVIVVANARAAPERTLEELDRVRRTVYETMSEDYPHLKLALLFRPAATR